MTKFIQSLLVSTMLAGAIVIGGVSAARAAEQHLTALASEKDPTRFATPELVVDAFKSAVAAGDADKLAELLGLDPAKAKATEGAKETFDIIQEGAKKNISVEKDGDTQIVVIGDRLWPFPFPISRKDDGKWSFDTYAGLDEILARRIGENEIFAIDTMGEYVEAQMLYALEDHDNDGVLEYAQKLISTDGTQDGLFWQSADGDAESPGGAALSAAAYSKAKQGDGYFGYHYRVLTSQGANIAGGQFDYVINGNMIAGFALVAWPEKYGETGIHTFVVNKEGIVYQADLGKDTDRLARNIRTFNPGDSWEIVDDE